jgi:hypothetical protein
MPVSKRQLRWANSPSGHAALGDSRVKQWDSEAKGVSLPERSSGPESSKIVESHLNRDLPRKKR